MLFRFILCFNIHSIGYIDSLLSGLVQPVPMNLNNQGSTVFLESKQSK